MKVKNETKLYQEKEKPKQRIKATTACDNSWSSLDKGETGIELLGEKNVFKQTDVRDRIIDGI